MDSLLSIVQMPGGVPVGTLAIGKAGAINAGLLAAAILATADEALATRLDGVARGADRRALPRRPNEQGRADDRTRWHDRHIWAAASSGGCWRWRRRSSAIAATSSRPIRTAACQPRSRAESTRASYDDEAALARFAAAVDVVTYEFENVPVSSAEALAGARAAVFPPPTALAYAQDRGVEKEFVAALGVATAPYARVDDRVGLDAGDRAGRHAGDPQDAQARL